MEKEMGKEQKKRDKMGREEGDVTYIRALLTT